MKLHGFDQLQAVAEGGMAILYRGIQTSLQRPVAIKVMKQALLDTPEAHDLFDRESRIVAHLDHPNIIRVIDRGLTPDGMPYFVMDYVEGKTLKQALKDPQFDQRRRLRSVIQVAKALGYAHRNGIIHRDIKPGNILLDRQGNARVVDFGIASLACDEATVTGTTTNFAIGTPAYMAPEQVAGNAISSACDIYALGIILYMLLTGTKPDKSAPQPPSALKPGIPSALDKITLACLAPTPEQRPGADKLVSMLLLTFKGAHLDQRQQEAAKAALADPKDRFRLLDVIRETPQATVCLYENRSDHQLMVLKKRAVDSVGFNAAQQLAKLEHRHLVRVLGVSRNERIYITLMEYVAGGSLQARMASPLSVEAFLPIARQLCDGMHYAHQHGLVHGALKPQNVLFTDEQTLRIMDFGEYAGSYPTSPYHPPHEEISRHSDVFAAGALFYEMLCGSLPEWDRGLFRPCAVFACLPQSLRTVLKGMLCLDPDVRTAHFGAVRQHLELVLTQGNTQPSSARAASKPLSRGPRKRHPYFARYALLTGMLGASVAMWALINVSALPEPMQAPVHIAKSWLSRTVLN